MILQAQATQKYRKAHASRFSNLFKEFMKYFGPTRIVNLLGTLDEDGNFVCTHTQYLPYPNFQKALVKTKAFEPELKKLFDEQMKIKKTQMYKKHKYKFGPISPYMADCMVELKLAELRLSIAPLYIQLVVKNFRKHVSEKGWNHKPFKLKIGKDSQDYKDLKYNKILWEVSDPNQIPPHIYKNADKIWAIKRKIVYNLYNYVRDQHQRISEQLSQVIDNVPFVIKDRTKFQYVLVGMLGAGIIDFRKQYRSYKERQSLFEEILFYFRNPQIHYSKIIKEAEQSPKTENTFKELWENFPQSEERI